MSVSIMNPCRFEECEAARKLSFASVDLEVGEIDAVIASLVTQFRPYYEQFKPSTSNLQHGFCIGAQWEIGDRISGLQSPVKADSFMTHLSHNTERYYLDFNVFSIDDVDSTSPLGKLIFKIDKVIQESGFACSGFKVRFEKGVLKSKEPNWHFDYPGEWAKDTDSSVVGFSSKSVWATKLIDDLTLNTTEYPHPQNLPARLEEKIFTAASGRLYNANQLLHRSPRLTDLGDESIEPADWRLFIQVTGRRDKK